jgi:hypothetical protein
MGVNVETSINSETIILLVLGIALAGAAIILISKIAK